LDYNGVITVASMWWLFLWAKCHLPFLLLWCTCSWSPAK